MSILIFEIVFFFGLGAMIYLIARALPRIGDDLSPASPSTPVDRLLGKIPVEKLDEVSSRVLEKVLRRTRLAILRLDNFLGKSLESVKRSNGNGGMNGNGKTTLFITKKEKNEEVATSASSSSE